METTEIKLALTKVNELIEKINEATRELRTVTCDVVNACGKNGIFRFSDETSYPYYIDDTINEVEAIIEVKAYNTLLYIKTRTDCDFFDPTMYGRVNYEEICRIILDNTPIVMG
jgi:hypothetical protein